MFFITKRDSFIKNRDSYYEMRRLLQNASVHGIWKFNMVNKAMLVTVIWYFDTAFKVVVHHLELHSLLGC